MNAILLGVLSAIPIAILLWANSNTPRNGPLEIPLARSPQRLGILDIIHLYIKAILKAVPGYTPALRPDAERKGFELPLISLRGNLDITDEDVRLFDKALRRQDGKAEGNVLFLVALTLPLLVQLFTLRSCPIKPLGAVNTKNKFRILDHSRCSDWAKLQEAAHLDQLKYLATFGGRDQRGIRKKRGVEFCVKITVYLEDEQRAILEQELWFLQFLHKSTSPRYITDPSEQATQEPNPEPQDSRTTYRLSLSPTDPKLWAACCKDYNPIHISRMGARLFGFPSVIAHGNHVLARVLEQRGTPTDRPFEVGVEFKRPLTLPADAKVIWQGPGYFEVIKGGKVCVEGRVI